MPTTEFLTAAELSQRWKGIVSTGTLANWRAQKPNRGPAFVKLRGGVLYPLDKVMEWERDNMRPAASGNATK